MTVVISDASPIRSLVELRLLEILDSLYGKVFIPPAVYQELVQPSSRLTPISPAIISRIEVKAPTDVKTVNRLKLMLDDGESEAIALAKEIRCDYLLIDENAGRRIATKMGLRITGVMGILIQARDAGLIRQVGPLLRRLKDEFDFWITDSLIREAEKDGPPA